MNPINRDRFQLSYFCRDSSSSFITFMLHLPHNNCCLPPPPRLCENMVWRPSTYGPFGLSAVMQRWKCGSTWACGMRRQCRNPVQRAALALRLRQCCQHYWGIACVVVAARHQCKRCKKKKNVALAAKAPSRHELFYRNWERWVPLGRSFRRNARKSGNRCENSG